MWEFETFVVEVIQQTPDIKTFRFDTGYRKDVRYKAGQYFFVTIRIVDGRESVHHFTISSSPTETAKKGYVEFTKRITDSEYSRALDRLKLGDWARLRGAEGHFTLPLKKRPLAFLSGGIGITPLRSMLRYIVDKGLQYDIVLIYANTTWENIAFREELEETARANEGIRVEYLLSGPDFPPGWEGKKGFVTKDLVAELIPDYRERIFYVSGPLRMVVSLEEQLTAIDIPRQRVKRDYFPGYD